VLRRHVVRCVLVLPLAVCQRQESARQSRGSEGRQQPLPRWLLAACCSPPTRSPVRRVRRPIRRRPFGSRLLLLSALFAAAVLSVGEVPAAYGTDAQTVAQPLIFDVSGPPLSGPSGVWR